jgi:protein-S-isoprenylcysteine O-methyltransferase Ste14
MKMLGFALLFVGRFGLGDSFRIGSPKEHTGLNPILLVIAVYIIAIHHRIVLAEEAYLTRVFGQEFGRYCGQVRRYL